MSRTVTVADGDIRDAAREAIDRLGLRGAVTLQYLRDTESGRLMLMEINPRLGGGVVCSIHAGADIPTMILTEACGEPYKGEREAKSGVMICRYFEEAVFNV